GSGNDHAACPTSVFCARRRQSRTSLFPSSRRKPGSTVPPLVALKSGSRLSPGRRVGAPAEIRWRDSPPHPPIAGAIGPSLSALKGGEGLPVAALFSGPERTTRRSTACFP